MTNPLWRPTQSQIETSRMDIFRRQMESDHQVALPTYEALHAWSISQPEAFWSSLWDFAGIVGAKGSRIIVDGHKMPGAAFFPDANLNFAENLLRKNDDTIALHFNNEGELKSAMSWRELNQSVSKMRQFFRKQGIHKGDRIAAVMPNMPETIVAMLAAASIGAIWSSCSPDFGAKGVLDRFSQIEPKLLITCDGYRYNGKELPLAPKIREIAAALPTLVGVVTVPLIEAGQLGVDKETAWSDVMDTYEAAPIFFERLPFDHPLYIMFSSGTTGAPKCIVHSAGGVLLNQLKEHCLHVSLTPDDTLFYFTTCGWMMWNWLVAGLGVGASLALYDGSPFYPDGNVLFDYADAVDVNVFGTSAKFIDALNKQGFEPAKTHKLANLRMILSTGSPLVGDAFDYVYRAIKPDVALCSISGGTDILSCFVLGAPILPVWRGEIQCKGLGMAVDIWDDAGQSVTQEKGELVCTKSFPSMPIGFWNDPDNSKYHNAYFDRFDNVWCHGDFAEVTNHGGLIIHGRSDATLNPGGVRIGTAEIYAQVEPMPQIVEALAIGQDFEEDVRVVLFVVLSAGVTLDEVLEKALRTKIRTGASPRHVPARIVAVADIPRTKSGKITELAVRDIVHGREVKNKEALANPEALDLFRDIPKLQS